MLHDSEILEIAHNVLDLESQSLKLLSDTLDESFVQAVQAINAIIPTKGRVIITGMGKSGHIGRKIAASMSSLGTTAYFVHPGEASHGDLGMIEPNDIVIALSNSGEAPELNDIIAFCRRFDIVLIGMTGKRNSSLGRQSNIVLCLPEIKEACPFGMAPTTSTTLMLALGDALAVALLRLHNFSKDEYKMRHPGGKLGKMMLLVQDLMHKEEELPLVTLETGIEKTLEEMTKKGFGCVGVISQEGLFCGIFTDGDLRRSITPDLMNKTVSEVMTRTPQTTSPQTLVLDALRIMNTTGKGITSLFVLENSKPVGLLHMHDCLRAGVA